MTERTLAHFAEVAHPADGVRHLAELSTNDLEEQPQHDDPEIGDAPAPLPEHAALNVAARNADIVLSSGFIRDIDAMFLPDEAGPYMSLLPDYGIRSLDAFFDSVKLIEIKDHNQVVGNKIYVNGAEVPATSKNAFTALQTLHSSLNTVKTHRDAVLADQRRKAHRRSST